MPGVTDQLSRPAPMQSDELDSLPKSPRTQRSATVVLLFVAALGFVIVVFNRALLPAYYFNDDATLRQYMSGAPQVTRHNSFETAAAVFDFLGLHDASTAVGVITYLLLLIGVVLAYQTAPASGLTSVQTAIFALAILMGAIYLGQLSKEPFVLVVVLAFLVLARSKLGEIAWGLLFVLPLALYLRPYWALVGLIYLAYRWWFRRPRSARHLIYLPIVGLLAFSVAAHLFLGKSSVVSFRTEVQHDLYGVYGTANSTIKDYLPVTGLGYGWPDAVLSVVLLVVPIPLILLGGIQYLAIGAVVAGLWARFVGAVRSFRTDLRRMSPIALRCTFLTISFVSVQGIFEPDYGSYLRHLTDLMPVFLVVIASGATREVPSQAREASRARAGSIDPDRSLTPAHHVGRPVSQHSHRSDEVWRLLLGEPRRPRPLVSNTTDGRRRPQPGPRRPRPRPSPQI